MRLLKSVILIVLLFMPTASGACWLIFHEPAYNGKVVDIETKQPIEGAVVVVLYQKDTFAFPGGSVDSVINVAETLTDNQGNFHLSSYTTFIQPFSWQIRPSFIIFKPGYANISRIPLADYFRGKKLDEQEDGFPYDGYEGLKYKIRTPGIVELPRLKTEKQLRDSGLVSINRYSARELPLLYKAKDELNTLCGRCISH